jgi:hypothetical protein
MNTISEHGLLEVLAGFDEHGGASPGLVAWELFVDEQQVKGVHALAEGWLRPCLMVRPGRGRRGESRDWRRPRRRHVPEGRDLLLCCASVCSLPCGAGERVRVSAQPTKEGAHGGCSRS